MDIAKTVERSVKFLVKIIFILMGLCLALQLIACWLSRLHLSAQATLALWVLLAAASVTSYFVRKHRIPAKTRSASHHGAERTPLMPRREEQL